MSFSPRIRILPYQQNLSRLPVAVVVLVAKSNRIDELLPLIPSLSDYCHRFGPVR